MIHQTERLLWEEKLWKMLGQYRWRKKYKKNLTFSSVKVSVKTCILLYQQKKRLVHWKYYWKIILPSWSICTSATAQSKKLLLKMRRKQFLELMRICRWMKCKKKFVKTVHYYIKMPVHTIWICTIIMKSWADQLKRWISFDKNWAAKLQSMKGVLNLETKLKERLKKGSKSKKSFN